MAHISGVFSNAAAGRLRVLLSGQYWQGEYRRGDFGSSGPNSSADYAVCALINGVATAPISKNVPDVELLLDYPGGNVPWPVSTATVFYVSAGGFTGNGQENLTLDLELTKR